MQFGGSMTVGGAGKGRHNAGTCVEPGPPYLYANFSTTLNAKPALPSVGAAGTSFTEPTYGVKVVRMTDSGTATTRAFPSSSYTCFDSAESPKWSPPDANGLYHLCVFEQGIRGVIMTAQGGSCSGGSYMNVALDNWNGDSSAPTNAIIFNATADPPIIYYPSGLTLVKCQHNHAANTCTPVTTLFDLANFNISNNTCTVTNATWASGTATITCASAPPHAVNSRATVTGITPSGYNGNRLLVTAVSGSTFSYAVATNPGAYTSGGTGTMVNACANLANMSTTYDADANIGLAIVGGTDTGRCSQDNYDVVIHCEVSTGVCRFFSIVKREIGGTGGPTCTTCGRADIGYIHNSRLTHRISGEPRDAWLSFADVCAATNNNCSFTIPVNGITRSANVVTVTTASPHTYSVNGTVIVTGVDGCATAPNGTFTVASVPTSSSFTFSQTGPNETCGSDANGCGAVGGQCVSSSLPPQIWQPSTTGIFDMTGSQSGFTGHRVGGQAFMLKGNGTYETWKYNASVSNWATPTLLKDFPQHMDSHPQVMNNDGWVGGAFYVDNLSCTPTAAYGCEIVAINSSDARVARFAHHRVDDTPVGFTRFNKLHPSLDGKFGFFTSNMEGTLMSDSAIANNGISRSGSTVTVTTSAAHGFSNGNSIVISAATGCSQDPNGTFTIAGVTSTTFTYTQGSTTETCGGASALASRKRADVFLIEFR